MQDIRTSDALEKENALISSTQDFFISWKKEQDQRHIEDQRWKRRMDERITDLEDLTRTTRRASIYKYAGNGISAAGVIGAEIHADEERDVFVRSPFH
jgi:hypothetical protein